MSDPLPRCNCHHARVEHDDSGKCEFCPCPGRSDVAIDASGSRTTTLHLSGAYCPICRRSAHERLADEPCVACGHDWDEHFLPHPGEPWSPTPCRDDDGCRCEGFVSECDRRAADADSGPGESGL